MLEINKSIKILKKATKLIPGLTQTFSKGPQVYGYKGVPHYLSKAKGAEVVDVDGNKYIDYSMGLGSVIIGHANHHITTVVSRQIKEGNSFSLMHPLEVDVSQQLLTVCPWADMVRFGKNGSDAMTAAIRLARAVSGRDIIAVANNYGLGSPGAYHGWHDWSAGLSPMPNGIPQNITKLTVTFDFNDSASLECILKKNSVAAIVMEGSKFIPPTKEFVDELHRLKKKYNNLLIIDEVANGFRLAPGGAHELFNIKPDLVAYGKSLGNGFAISALVGKRQWMKHLDQVMFTLTYGGETTGLSAALKVMELYKTNRVYEQMIEKGTILMNEISNTIGYLGITNKVKLLGYPARFALCPVKEDGSFDGEKSQQIRTLLLQNGVLCASVHNMSLALTQSHIKKTSNVYVKVLSKVYRRSV